MEVMIYDNSKNDVDALKIMINDFLNEKENKHDT